MRSLLLVAGDDPARLAAALSSAAHAVVVDLGVAAERREAARANAVRALADEARHPDGPSLIVRVNPLDSGETDADLDAIMPGAPFAVMLPKVRGGASVQQLAMKLALREALNGLDDGATAIIASIDDAAGLLAAAGLRDASARLAAVAWDAEAIAAEVGTQQARDGAGGFTAPLGTARDLVLIAAAAAGVAAIDTGFSRPGSDALGPEATGARRAGFAAKIARDPAEAAIVNAAFAAAPDGVN